MSQDCKAQTAELQRPAAISSRRKQAIVVGADANSDHMIWSSSGINQRGESLFISFFIKWLVVKVANRDEEPSFIGLTSRNVLDILVDMQWDTAGKG